jgi:hypothetical protein
MDRLQSFKNSKFEDASGNGPPNAALSIRAEMNLLIETQDICDELAMLKMVLADQDGALSSLRSIFAGLDGEPWAKNRVLETIAHRIERMERAATDTKKSVCIP